MLDRIQRSHSRIGVSTFRNAIAKELTLEDLCKFVCQFGQNETLKLVAFLEDDNFQGLRKVCNTSKSLLPFAETVKKELEHYPDMRNFSLIFTLYATNLPCIGACHGWLAPLNLSRRVKM